MPRARLRAATCLAMVAGWSCAGHRTSAGGPVAAERIDPWVLELTDPSATEPALVWNGKIGARISRAGSGLEGLPFFDSRAYQVTGEEKIRRLQNPLEIRLGALPDAREALRRHEPSVDHGDSGLSAFEDLDPERGSGYRQSLDMRTGVLTTDWTQPFAKAILHVEAQAAIDPDRRRLGLRWTLSASGPVPIRVAVLAPMFLTRVSEVLTSVDLYTSWAHVWVPRFESGSAIGVLRVRGRHAADSSGWQNQSVTVDTRWPASIEWVVDFDGRARKYAFLGRAPASTPDTEPPALHFDDIARASAAGAKRRNRTDIVIDGPAEDQRAVRSFLYYLRTAVDGEGAMSVSPFGLSGDPYGGHVFWDADTWVFPALDLLDPPAAKAIADYRLRMEPAARANYGTLGLRGAVRRHEPSVDDENATGDGVSPGPQGARRPDPSPAPGQGLRYPWESSVTGRETATGDARDEIHISGDVARMEWTAAALGLVPRERAKAIVDGVAAYYRAISEPGRRGREIRHAFSTDEYWHVDNDLYTNLLAEWATHPTTFGDLPPTYRMPSDGHTFLSYDDDRLTAYKQAAALLSVYPLQYLPAEREAGAMLDRFAGKVSPNGPAMTQAINAIIRARQGQVQRAYADWRASWRPFTKSALMLFSEKAGRPETYFTTGAAGALQGVLYGFLGIRLDYKKEPGAAWSCPLLNGSLWMSINPNLPPEWKSVKLTNFTILGRRFTLTATHGRATVEPEPNPPRPYKGD